MPVIRLSSNAPHQTMRDNHLNSTIPMPTKLYLPTTTIYGITQWMPNKVNTIDHKSKVRGQWIKGGGLLIPHFFYTQHQSKIKVFCFQRLSIVKIFPKTAIQTHKKKIPRRDTSFQTVFQGKDWSILFVNQNLVIFFL